MSTPRVTIGGLMIGVLILAANFAVFRWIFTADYRLIQVVMGAIPPVNALVIGLFLVVRRSMRGELVRPFHAGFVGSCALVLLGYVSLHLVQPKALQKTVQGAFAIGKPWLDRFGTNLDLTSMRDWIFGIGVDFFVVWTVLAAPQFLLASLGGWITARCARTAAVAPKTSKPSTEGVAL